MYFGYFKTEKTALSYFGFELMKVKEKPLFSPLLVRSFSTTTFICPILVHVPLKKPSLATLRAENEF